VSNVTDVPAQLEIGEISSTVSVEAVAANVQVNTSDATAIIYLTNHEF